MAAVLDQISIATLGAYPDLNNALLSRDCALLRLLQENQVTTEDGDPINITVRYKRNNGGSYSGYDQFDTAHVDQLAQGTVQWKFVYVNVTIDEGTLVRNAGLNIKDLLSVQDVKELPTPSRKAVFNVFGNEFSQSLDDMKDLLATMIYSDGSGNGGKDVTGVATIVDSSDAYAGISVSELGTFDYNGILSGSQDNLWASKEVSKSNASIDLDMLADLLDDCAVGGHSPNWVFLPRDLYSSVSLQLEGQKVRESSEASEIGFRNAIEWVDYGATFYRDEYCTANTVYAVNGEFFKLYVHPALNFVFSNQLRLLNLAICWNPLKPFSLTMEQWKGYDNGQSAGKRSGESVARWAA